MLFNHKKHKSHKLGFCAFCGHSRQTSRCRILQKARLFIQSIGVHSCPFVVRRSPWWIFFPRRASLRGPWSSFGRVENWRVDCRVRWLFRRFRFGPQSGSLVTFPVPALRTGRAVFPHLGSPVGSCVSHTGPRSHSWTTPLGLAPLPYSIHFRFRVAAKPVDALTTPSSSHGPFTFACDASGVSGPFAGVSGFRHSRDPSPFGHRSSPEAPSLHGSYPTSPVLQASPPPCRPGLTLTSFRFGVCLTTLRASRVATFFPFHACQRHYPDGSRSVLASLSSPSAIGLPLKPGGSASVLSVSRPARRSLAFRPACSLSRPWRPFTPECFRPFRYLHDPPWLLPTGATVVGRGSHPPEEGAFPRRTGPSWITLFP